MQVHQMLVILRIMIMTLMVQKWMRKLREMNLVLMNLISILLLKIIEILQKNKQKLELPSSDDSEDDDYNPDAPDLSDQVKQESSSSDFTSNSTDFSVAFNDNISPCKDEPVPNELMSASSDQNKPCGVSNGERSKVGWRKKQSLNDELSYLLKLGLGQGESAPLSGKGHVERLDYERLHD
ncbi:unnamed protein product [Camellia sinensis]